MTRFGKVSGLALVMGLCAAAAARADTIMSVTETHYDAAGRADCVATRMDPTTFGNAPANACTLVTTSGTYGPDRITKTTYDAMDHVVELDQAYGTSIQRAYARYTYTDNGQKATETDADGNKTAFVYDGFDRLSKIQYPSTTSPGTVNTADYEQFDYDEDSDKTSWRHRDGKIVSYIYDALKEETVRTVSDSSVEPVYSEHDLSGELLYSRFGSTSGIGITNVYDGLGRLDHTVDMNGRTVQHSYNQASTLTGIKVPGSIDLDYYRNNANRLNAIYSESMRLVTNGYDDRGHLTWRNYGDSGIIPTGYSYDQQDRLTSASVDLNGTADDSYWTFAYNPASQVISQTASSSKFDYIERHLLTDNRTYDGLNRDAAIAALSGGYDANGNLTNDGSRLFTYDVYNHLLTATGGGTNLNLVYDPIGRLAKYSSDGGVTYTTFLYDDTNLIGEYDATGNLTERYIHGDGTDEPLVWFHGSGTSDERFFVRDYHGNVIGYADASGNLADLYRYGPYGEPQNAANEESWSGARFRYTGQTIIPEAHLYYYKARVYDPIFGRFLQTDPVGSKDDLDLYSYVHDDPIDGSDPTGLWDGADDGAAIVGGLLAGGALEAGSQLLTSGRITSWKRVGTAAVGGAVTAEVTLYAGPVVGGAAGSALEAKMNGGSDEQVRNAAIGGGVMGGLGEVAGRASHYLPPSAKGKLGEALSVGKSLLRGEIPTGTQVRTQLSKGATIVDVVTNKSRVEAKFGAKARLSPAQRRAQNELPNYRVDRWLPRDVGRILGAITGQNGCRAQSSCR